MEDEGTKHNALSPAVTDESGMGGSTTAPDGFNTLDEVQGYDMYKNADDEHPAELNLAEQVANAEKTHQTED